MSDDGRDPMLGFRAPDPIHEAVEQLADANGLDKSELLRRMVSFAVETQGDQIADQADLLNRLEDSIEVNQEREKIATWRRHVRRQFGKYVQADMNPEHLEALADGYREQARLREDLADTIPNPPPVDDGELVGIVDEELAHAIDAVDLSTWYENVENPHAAHLSGVEDGEEDRRDLAALLEGVVQTHGCFYDAVDNPDRLPPVDPADLPPMADTLLPDGVGREDVAELATDLARSGVEPDEVRGVLKSGALPVPSNVKQDGGQPPEALPTGRDDDTRDQTVTVDASEATQQELIQAIAAADGGRSPGARAAGFNEEDTDMTGNTDDTDELDELPDDYDDPTEASDVLEALTDDAEGVRADE